MRLIGWPTFRVGPVSLAPRVAFLQRHKIASPPCTKVLNGVMTENQFLWKIINGDFSPGIDEVGKYFVCDKRLSSIGGVVFWRGLRILMDLHERTEKLYKQLNGVIHIFCLHFWEGRGTV